MVIFRFIRIMVFFSLRIGFAQEAYVVKCPFGNYIFCGLTLAKDFTYTIYRQMGPSDRKQIAALSAPVTFDEFSRNLDSLEFWLGAFDDEQVAQYFSYIQENDALDTLRCAYLAKLWLSAGVAVLDSETPPTAEVTYTIYRENANQEEIGEFRPTLLESPTESFIRIDSATFEYSNMLVEGTVIESSPSIAFVEIYRRDNLGGTFKKLPGPVLFEPKATTNGCFYYDSTAQENNAYEYFLQPLDPFLNPGFPSDTIFAHTFDPRFPPLLHFAATDLDNDYQVEITWDFERKPFMRGLKLFRSTDFFENYQEIAELPMMDSVYVDQIELGGEAYYYRLQLNGPVGWSYPSTATSVVYRGEDIPRAPTYINSFPLPDGVGIKWMSEESHLSGFYVYRKNPGDSTLAQVSNLIKATPDSILFRWRDTTCLPYQAYHYSVRSINDLHHLSKFSDTISAVGGHSGEIPVPSGLEIQYRENGVRLFWDNMRHIFQYLGSYHVYRRSVTDTTWTEIAYLTLPDFANHYVDSNVSVGDIYQYRISCADYLGRQGPPSTVQQLNLPKPNISPPTSVNYRVEGSAVRIMWGQRLGTDNIAEFIVERKSTDLDYQEIGRTTEREFVDDDPPSNIDYFYRIKCVDLRGRAGPPSDPLLVIFNQ